MQRRRGRRSAAERRRPRPAPRAPPAVRHTLPDLFQLLRQLPISFLEQGLGISRGLGCRRRGRGRLGGLRRRPEGMTPARQRVVPHQKVTRPAMSKTACSNAIGNPWRPGRREDRMRQILPWHEKRRAARGPNSPDGSPGCAEPADERRYACGACLDNSAATRAPRTGAAEGGPRERSAPSATLTGTARGVPRPKIERNAKTTTTNWSVLFGFGRPLWQFCQIREAHQRFFKASHFLHKSLCSMMVNRDLFSGP